MTDLLTLGPHLTEENLVEVLARAKHRTKKEIARLVRMLDPLPDVPPRIEPLGPTPAPLVPEAPTWREFVQSTCPVRELTPGDRPRDWVENDAERANDIDGNESATPVVESANQGDSPVSAPARLTPQRYSVQFTASEEYVKLVEEARALLSRSAPRPALDDLHLRAMRALVAELKRQKYAVTERPRKRAPSSTPQSDQASEVDQASSADEATVSRLAVEQGERRLEFEIGLRHERGGRGSPISRVGRALALTRRARFAKLEVKLRSACSQYPGAHSE